MLVVRLEVQSVEAIRVWNRMSAAAALVCAIVQSPWWTYSTNTYFKASVYETLSISYFF